MVFPAMNLSKQNFLALIEAHFIDNQLHEFRHDEVRWIVQTVFALAGEPETIPHEVFNRHLHEAVGILRLRQNHNLH